MSGVRDFVVPGSRGHVPFLDNMYGRWKVLCFLCGKEAPFKQYCRENRP